MKNIHVIPTTEATNLIYHNGRYELLLPPEDKETWNNNVGKYIYITSDEEIKLGDYILLPNDKIIQIPHGLSFVPINNFTSGYSLEDCKKIILTTDLELIKNGVQPIDDEFLEWFVKNSSCEFVEVKHNHFIKYGNMTMVDQNGDGSYYFCTNCEVEFSKSKQELLDAKVEYYKIIIPIEELKQETLEEAAYNRFPNQEFYGEDDYSRNELSACRDGFKEGAKWQKQKMYSEEDMLRFAQKYEVNKLDKTHLEQFKKK